ncbi:hypothetical protein Pst134EB_014601 [Puccinia striiformis f. sp. tritici]|nr:hypothetical protein Pst134EB_014601 [Puccinia striiformis f. sp. tritici]
MIRSIDENLPSSASWLLNRKEITEEGLTKHDLPALSGYIRVPSSWSPISTHGEVQIGVNRLALPKKIPDNPIAFPDTFGLVRNQFPSLIRSEKGNQ